MPLRTQNLMILLSVTDGPTDGRTDGRTDTAAYWDAMDASKNSVILGASCFTFDLEEGGGMEYPS